MKKISNATARKRLQESINKLIIVQNHMRMKGILSPSTEKKFSKLFVDLHNIKNSEKLK
tara:strand:- start:174 stop:350 length:177 start_codon:yes stop_codon:yes gene_type:complete